jgi:tetratricopeptide (TPR) repeat protein
MKNKVCVLRTGGSMRAASCLPLLFLLAVSCGPPAPSEETLLLYARSQAVYREGRFAEAAAMLAGEKGFAPVLVLRGKAEYLSGDFDAAEKTLKQALDLKPHDAEASLFLARLFRENGNIETALKFAETILADNPHDIRALRFAASLARERGVSGEAASAVLLDRAAEASWEVSAEAALVFLDRARLRWSGGNSGGALEDLHRARMLLHGDSPVTRAVETLQGIISEVAQ